MAKFKGFTNQQTHQLLSELGYDGPVDKEMMDAFVAATPSAASMLGRYNEMARDRIEGRAMSVGFQSGGITTTAGIGKVLMDKYGYTMKDGKYFAPTATPAPTPTTFAAGIVPAAVIIIGIAFS